MIWHVLGWTTVAAQGVGAVGVLRWLVQASRESRTWRRALVVPKFTEAHVPLSSGSDFVGFV